MIASIVCGFFVSVVPASSSKWRIPSIIESDAIESGVHMTCQYGSREGFKTASPTANRLQGTLYFLHLRIQALNQIPYTIGSATVLDQMDGPSLSDRPVRHHQEKPSIGWGSDAIAEQLSRLDLGYIALVPGSSYRGLHDSLVNYLGNAAPELLVCLHEEHAVAIAHGYAKVTERPMAAAVHANVGLMHATMAVYNAFCDRTPIIILGATGPVDSSKKRPWIDWIHTATDQAALIRPFVKFDDQPHSVNAAVMSLLKSYTMAVSKPCAPVYVCLDVSLQEDRVDPETIKLPDSSRYLKVSQPGAAEEDLQLLLAALQQSSRPLLLFGRMNRTMEGWDERIRLAEKYNARVLTDLKQASAFPTAHRLHACPPSVMNSPQAAELINAADLVISFEWVDLAGTLQAATNSGEPPCKVAHISVDTALHNGWSKDHFGHPAVDIPVFADADRVVSSLLRIGSSRSGHSVSVWPPEARKEPQRAVKEGKDIFMSDLAEALYKVIRPEDMCLVRLPLSWNGRDLQSTHPLAYLGQDGGAGIASGPGQAVGAALALKGSPLLPVAILGDGDFLMGSSALWTAARYRLPMLVIVANNASFFNDEVHQERVARARTRPVENKWIGMRLDDPLPDLGQNAVSLGLTKMHGQVRDRRELHSVLEKAVKLAKEGASVVLDVRVLPDGYSSALEKAK